MPSTQCLTTLNCGRINSKRCHLSHPPCSGFWEHNQMRVCHECRPEATPSPAPKSSFTTVEPRGHALRGQGGKRGQLMLSQDYIHWIHSLVLRGFSLLSRTDCPPESYGAWLESCRAYQEPDSLRNIGCCRDEVLCWNPTVCD